jgi:lactoylglutathione lyase
LIPEHRIANILEDKTPHPSTGSGIPRCEIYLYTEDLHRFYKRLKESNAIEISPIKDRDWGDKVCYFSDPDGHIIAVAEDISI